VLNKLKKIVVIGPESTGKSTLCYQLAEHFQSLWVPEFARGYLEKKTSPYTYDELLIIAKGQVDLEDEYIDVITKPKKTDDSSSLMLHQIPKLVSIDQPKNKELLFIDTDMHVIQVWCEFAFGKCHNWILRQLAQRKYDLYFLCDVDLPWTRDELREYPDLETRNKLFQYYKEQMVNQYTPWVIISGNYEQRLQQAIQAVENKLY
jgi:nicotinamide riboside kinase